MSLPLPLCAFPSFHISDHQTSIFAKSSNLLQIDYSGDLEYLNSTAFDALGAVADFFVSYVTKNPVTGYLDIANSCAQEICGGGPSSESNPHHNIAYVAATVQALLRYAPRINRADDPRIAGWKALLDGLAPLPTGVPTGLTAPVWLEADDTASYFGSNAAAYCIVYLAALHPAETVSLSSPPEVVDVARATVEAVVTHNSWAPLNGLAMVWAPAARAFGPINASRILDGWENALSVHMNKNFYPDLGGGGIEAAGTTEAINSILLQSQESFIRVFPMWPAKGSDAAFADLRARGGFLVSGYYSGDAGAVAIFVIEADKNTFGDVPRDCAFLTPWADVPSDPVVYITPIRVQVPVTLTPRQDGLRVYTFKAVPGETYLITPMAD